MTYRDDRDADQARIVALEAELAAANRTVGELEAGRARPTALTIATMRALVGTGARVAGVKRPWYGAPLRLELTHSFEGTLSRDDLLALSDLSSAITRDAGHTEMRPTSMIWSASARADRRSIGPFTMAMVEIRDGRTSLIVSEPLGRLAVNLYGLSVLLGLGGTLLVPVFSVPMMIPGAIAWLGSVFFGTRALFTATARGRASDVEKLFTALVADISARLRPP